MAESEHAEGEDGSPAESEGDGIGVSTIVVEVADKSVQPSQVFIFIEICPDLLGPTKPEYSYCSDYVHISPKSMYMYPVTSLM